MRKQNEIVQGSNFYELINCRLPSAGVAGARRRRPRVRDCGTKVPNISKCRRGSTMRGDAPDAAALAA